MSKPMTDLTTKLAEALRRLHAENEALRKDAERYRWLRSKRVSEVAPSGMLADHRKIDFRWYSPIWEAGVRIAAVSVDAAIDAARKEARHE